MHYTFSNRLKIFSLALMLLGAIGWYSSYSASHVSLDDVKEMLAAEASGHGDGHGETATVDHAVKADAHADNSHGETVDHALENAAHHGDEHAEHVMHAMHNRPYSALYVAAFFFMMIA